MLGSEYRVLYLPLRRLLRVSSGKVFMLCCGARNQIGFSDFVHVVAPHAVM